MPKNPVFSPKKNILSDEEMLRLVNILMDLGIIPGTASCKVLAAGELKTALEVTANRFSASAKKAIQDAGGKAFTQFKLNSLQGIADADGVLSCPQIVSYYEELTFYQQFNVLTPLQTANDYFENAVIVSII